MTRSVEQEALAVPNDNRTPAGTLRDGVLELDLEARPVRWRGEKSDLAPDAVDPTVVEVLGFAEAAGPVMIPGPLIRVPQGTEVRVRVRNSIPEDYPIGLPVPAVREDGMRSVADDELVVRGLRAGTAPDDVLRVPRGEVVEVRYRADIPGTYFYWATPSSRSIRAWTGADSQLAGAIIVDPEGIHITRVESEIALTPQFDAALERCAAFPPAAQERLSFDRAELEELVHGVFGANGNDGPGAAVIVMLGDQVVTQRQYGMASLEHGVPFTPNQVVRLPYSEGREFIAIAAVLMENDGLIGLDRSVRDYFPRLPSWSEPVTIRDLIHHHSGFVDEWSVLLLMHGSMANRLDESQFLRLLYDQPAPEVEPGTGYMYSNSDYGLLRLILERAADENLTSYMRRRVFDPLHMNSTHLIDDFSEVVPNHAPFYAPTGDGYRHSDVKTSPGGNYRIATTACDLGQWANAHADLTSEISRAVVRLMDGAAPVPGLDGHYAFGHTFAEVAGTRVVRHEGVLEANYLTRIPDLGVSVITFSNRYYAPEENRAIVDFLLDPVGQKGGVRFPTEPVALSGEELARYVGRYVTTNVPSWESRTMARDLIGIDVAGAGLELDWPSWDRFALVSVGGRTFSWHSGPSAESRGMLFEFGDTDGDDPLELVIRYNDGYPDERFVRLEEWTPSSALLERLVGRYHSAHLDYTWSLLIDEAGELLLRAPTMADVRVEPYQQGEFLLRLEKSPGVPFHVWLRFHENEAGEITHLTVWNPRLMHHRLDRR